MYRFYTVYMVIPQNLLLTAVKRTLPGVAQALPPRPLPDQAHRRPLESCWSQEDPSWGFCQQPKHNSWVTIISYIMMLIMVNIIG